MVFKGLFGGGATIDTVLNGNRVYPGGSLQGVVNVSGGTKDMDVNFVELSLTARVEVETDDSEYDSNMAFNRKRISGPFRLQSGARHQLPFVFEVPWETPFNEVAGTSLHGVRVGMRTELDIARSLDKGDVDPLAIQALPAQERIVAGFAQIGFRLKGSDLERGHLSGSRLPFYQEVEFHPASQFRGQMNELEVKFVTRADSMDVVLEIDRRTMFGGSSDKTNRFTVSFAAAEQDWASILNDHLNRIMGGGSFGGRVDRHAAPIMNTPAPGVGLAPQGYSPTPGYQAPPPAYQQPAPSYQPPAPQQPPYQPPAPTYSQPPAAPAAHQSTPAYVAPNPVPAQPNPTPSAGINLTKGCNVNLNELAHGLSVVTVGLGWDESASVDIDASALVLDATGRTLSDDYFVFFNNLTSPDGAVEHGGDSASGAGHGDDEQITVDLSRLDPHADRVVFAVSIHDGKQFSQVRHAYIRVANAVDNREITRFDLSAGEHPEPAVVVGELYRAGNDWSFRAVGQGYADGLAGITRKFGLSV